MIARQLLPWMLVACLATGCAGAPQASPTSPVAVHEKDGALAVADALEELIARGADTESDRETAYAIVKRLERPGGEYAYARAVVAGRLAQSKGLLGGSLVAETEAWGRRAAELSPSLRQGAPQRLVGTLYVAAPATMLEHGDSEEGLSILEEVTETYPDHPENQLRLGEAFLALGEVELAREPLCRAHASKDTLRRDHQTLLAELLADAEATCQ